MHKTTLGLAVAVLCGCSSPSTGDPVGQSAARIVGGTPSSAAQDSVVFISLGANGFCSGTLIAPNLVLTARHCVANMNENSECGTFLADNAASTFSVAVGANVDQNNPSTIAQGVKVVDDGDPSGCSHDIALIQLDHDLQAPISPVRQAPAIVGETTVAVGFGDDGSGKVTNGRYQRGGIKVLGVGPGNFTYTQQGGQTIPVTVPPGEIGTGESTCYGDSGGPLFDAQGAVIGVTSRGTSNSCLDAPSIYSDVASHYAMIAQAAVAAGHPLSPTPGADAGTPSTDAGAPAPGDDGGAPPPNPGSSSSGGSSGGSSSGSSGSSGGSSSGSADPNGSSSSSGGSGNGGTGCAVGGGAAPDASWLAVLGAVFMIKRRRKRATG